MSQISSTQFLEDCIQPRRLLSLPRSPKIRCALRKCSGASMTAENRKQRLHRLELVFTRSPIYFITACTHNRDRKSTRLNSSHITISYAVFCLKKKKNKIYLITKGR